MAGRANLVKTILISVLVIVIIFFQYSTELSEHRHHLFYQGLLFLPIMLAGFWFGLRNALVTSLFITLLLLPFTFIYWEGFSAGDFNNLMELILYNAVALILGIIKNRERGQQKRLQEAERLAAVGKGVSGLAHDLKTPLIAIGAFSRWVRERIRPSDPLREKIKLIIEETQRLENMVTEILDFSRPLELRRSEEDVERLLSQCFAIGEAAAQERKVSLQKKPSKTLPLVSLDFDRMKEAVINLIMNAIEASPEGETVSVSAQTRRNNLVIEVSDRGCGIPPDKREEIFFPFFTTKREGTGLGLPIAKKIVEAHQGSLEVLDNPGGGTIFRVVIPFTNKGRKMVI